MISAILFQSSAEAEFFTEYGDASRYKIQEIVGKGSYGVVCSAIDVHTGEKVAIKKIHDIFEHISDAARILREIKLLRLLRHPDIVEIKHIMLPPSRRDFKDIYVVFELMESDLHQVIKANDDLTKEHYQFFLYQLLRALKYIHTANVYHRDLKPKNILANSNCKLKICDFGLARVAFNDTPTTIFWTDYVATRWYRAPELCGSFFSKILGHLQRQPANFLPHPSADWRARALVIGPVCIVAGAVGVTMVLMSSSTTVPPAPAGTPTKASVQAVPLGVELAGCGRLYIADSGEARCPGADIGDASRAAPSASTAASMTEAVRGRVRPEPSSMLSGALYSGMNAGSWRRAGTCAGEGGGVLVGQGGQKRAWDRSGLPQSPPTFVSGLLERKSRPDRSADQYRLREYTPAIDVWSIGCIFAEVLTGKPLFPGKNVVHQLDLMTDLLGTPSMDTISRVLPFQVRNEKARRYLSSMRKKELISFSHKFPNADPLALDLLQRLLAFDPKDRPTAEEALSHPYFKGLAKVEREPSCQPITKMEFEFERRRVTKEDIRELIFREILEYHPQLLKDYTNGTERTTFLYPSLLTGTLLYLCLCSAVDQFRKQFAHLEENSENGPVVPMDRKHTSLPRSTIVHSAPIHGKEQPRIGPSRDKPSPDESYKNHRDSEKYSGNVQRTSQAPQRVPTARPGRVVGPVLPYENGGMKDTYDPRRVAAMSSGYPPQQQIPQIYGYYQTPAKSACSEPSQAEMYTLHQQAYACANSSTVPDVALDMRAPPFHQSAGPKRGSSDRLSAESNLYSRSLNGMAPTTTGVAASAHRKVGVVPYGMSQMY
ncbi:unnamed protein product [Triticum turgidum subsp. durum]|uniref:Protein kinase domain-containing protein n=1 Tax=Triticum turgidum subsp. durum TaxID=4567 RepID=A0A9R0RL02_TRITD|nr:unnamed protein product [Triticum turgidum subsp. durum]